MILNKLIFGFFCLTIILAHPLLVKRDESRLSIRATRPAPQPAARSPPKPVAHPAQRQAAANAPPQIQLYTGNSPKDRARKANRAPGREIPKRCKHFSDCSCPHLATRDLNSKAILGSTSCIGGWCSCNNPVANLVANEYVKGVQAFANSTPLKVAAQVAEVAADIKEVVGTVVGTVLGPVGKFATKVGLQAVPDFGPSHLDQLTGGAFKKLSGLLGQCKKASDCSCPKDKSDSNRITQSTSCINGVCSCSNAAANFFVQKLIGAAAAFGNAPITKAVGQTMRMLSDVVEVAGTVGKYDTKAFPDVGPSHIDQVAKGAALKKIV